LLTKAPRPSHTVGVLSLAVLVFASAQTSVAPAIPQMAHALNSTTQTAAWSFTAYMVSAAVLTPVIGRLGDMFGKRRLLAVVLALFAVGALVAAAVPRMDVVILGRVVQGAGGGIVPLSFGLIRDHVPAVRRAGAIGVVSSLAGLGMGFGLVLGGVLVDRFSFEAIFWTAAGTAALAAVAVRVVVEESPGAAARWVDWWGIAVLSGGLFAVMLAIGQLNRWGAADPRTIALVLAGLVLLLVFGLVEGRVPHPLLDLGLLAHPSVLLANVASLLVGFAAFSVFVLVPQYAQTPDAAGFGFGSDATQVGLLMMPGCVLMVSAGPLAARLARTAGSKVPMAMGSTLIAVGMLFLVHDRGSLTALFAPTALVLFGLGLSFASTATLIIDHAPAGASGEASGVNAVVRALGNALGVQTTAAVVSVGGGQAWLVEARYSTAFLLCAAAAAAATFTAGLVARGGMDLR
jgi:MFS family permease